MKRTLFLLPLVLLLSLTRCGGGQTGPVIPPAGSGSSSSGGTVGSGPAAPAASATLAGKITFEGTAPPPKKIQMGSDPVCAKKAKDPVTEDVVVNGGALANVIIYVSSEVNNTFTLPTEAITIDQNGCHYIPHSFTLMAGQKLTIKNSDDTLHNIHAFGVTNAEFNTGQPVPTSNDHVFDKAEMPLPFKCDVHKWMSAFAGVFNHPYHSVSKADGTYEFKLAPGSYEITAWHETLGTQKMKVEVKDGQKTDLNFTFKAAASAD